MQSTPETVTVLGAGSWGVTLAQLLARRGVRVRLWGRHEKKRFFLTTPGENVKYQPDESPQNLDFTTDFGQAVAHAKWIVTALPSSATPELAERLCSLKSCLDKNATLVGGTKGLHPASGLRASQTWQQAGWPLERFVALSGPNLAGEIADGVPTSTVVASQSLTAARAAQKLLNTPLFRVYTNRDLIGVELGGALKNVIAIAAGVGDGLGYRDNAKAALLTRGWHEMTRLAVALGARESTLFGLSGIGDLFATCMSPHSRNHALGCLLGKGQSLQQARHTVVQTAEGVHTTQAALRLAATVQVELPVTQQVAAVLFEGRCPQEAVATLMQRAGRDEDEEESHVGE